LSPQTRKPPSAETVDPRIHEASQALTWEIASIGIYLQEIRAFWAKEIGVSGPQWMILMAVSDLDKGEGASVKTVAGRLHVDPSFVTTNSKLLEKRGLLRRRVSKEDARVVEMSLTDRVAKQMADLARKQEALDSFIYAEMTPADLETLTAALGALKRRLEKARLRIASEY
jgi:DNA-binding MarR family transcriptional regulator